MCSLAVVALTTYFLCFTNILQCSLPVETDSTPCFQVYVRRAYISYDLACVKHFELPSPAVGASVCVVLFSFFLPTSHPNRWVHARRPWGSGCWFHCTPAGFVTVSTTLTPLTRSSYSV